MQYSLKFLYFIPFLFISLCSYNQETDNKDDIVLFADVDPEYPGGMTALYHFLSSNINYPERALKKGIQGKCLVGFIVDKEGYISEVNVIQKVRKCKECDAEAIRVIKLMPQWKSGYVKGKPVKCRYQIPINFKLVD